MTLVAGVLCTRGSGHNLYAPLLANAGGEFFCFLVGSMGGGGKRTPIEPSQSRMADGGRLKGDLKRVSYHAHVTD